MPGTAYTRDFYAQIQSGSLRSARTVAPVILELLRPRSIVDVGCGTGAWLRAFAELGVDDYLGVDGAYVRPESLVVPPERFRAHDLAAPLRLARRFDLAISLEVAEHLPPAAADTFVASLTAVAPAVVFSAAIPGQRGVRHVNEQWPEYWAERFARHGFRAVDCLRRRFWSNPDVEAYYVQNMLLFAQPDLIERSPVLEAAAAATDPSALAFVHPRIYLLALDPVDTLLRAVAPALPAAWYHPLELTVRRAVRIAGRLRQRMERSP